MYIERLVLGALQTNCYLVAQHKNSNQMLIIDPADDPDYITHQLCGRDVVGVFLTHGHFDHTGALSLFEGLPIYIHEADAPYLADAALGACGFPGIPYEARPQATHLLHDGDEIHLEGFETPLQVMHTPGHTPGSSVFRMGDDLFTGDTLFRRSYGRYDLPGGDRDLLFQSLRMLLLLPEDLKVYPGHGPETTLNKERHL